VDHEKAQFPTRFGTTLAADVYRPKGARGALAALAVCGPFGAVKEQSSGIYAQTMAERGYLAMAVDPAFTGESGGCPRNVASPDIATEDYGAAVDYLTTRDDVDPGRIGIIGICGHEDVATTHKYMVADMEMKERAHDKSASKNPFGDGGNKRGRYVPEEGLLALLESL